MPQDFGFYGKQRDESELTGNRNDNDNYSKLSTASKVLVWDDEGELYS